jgi:hypothetical protein
MPSADLRTRRETVVREHLASENAHDFDTTIATFGHPRYGPRVPLPYECAFPFRG